MIFKVPPLSQIDLDVLGLIHEQRDQLRYQVNQNPLRWTGFLRRNTFARALQGSNSIEGINASLDEAVAIVDDEAPETLLEETLRALQGYRTAMTYVLSLQDDPYTVLSPQLLRSVHFMMLNYDMTKMPGQWRSGPIYVVREQNGEQVYEAPDADIVPSLIDELIDQITGNRDIDTTVIAAMAHLNLTMIHPFKDGNGRMARALQTLVLARDGVSSPTFCSIEEWLGRNTNAYYDILEKVGQGVWHPENDAYPWVQFCLTAHYQQSATLMKRNKEIGRIWTEIERVRQSAGLPERCELPLMDAAFGYKVRNQRYRETQEISDVVASRDLRRLCELGWLEPVGETRGRYYVASKALLAVRGEIRTKSKAANPYDVLRSRQEAKQIGLPGID